MLLAAPLFFFITQLLYVHETDEALILQKEEFILSYAPKLEDNEIPVFNKLNRDLKIEKRNPLIIKDTLYNQNLYNSFDNENEPYRILNAPVVINKKNYLFSAKINLVDNSDFIISLLAVFTLIILTLLIGLFSITKRLSITLWKPFYGTLEQIEKFEIDKNSNPNLLPGKIEEFNRLNQAIHKLIERNTLIYKSQREFIENAAHELQTPIAIFKGKLETLLQRPDVTEEQFEILDKLNDTTTRLNRLNKNLLLLSKIEGKYFDNPDHVILNETIINQLDFFKEQALAKQIKITVKLEPEITVKSNLFLSEVLISNLFLNAVNHNTTNGVVHVVLDKNALTFSNTGTSKPLVTNKLFERFSKVNPSSKGNGLGLSIIKKIVDNNQWSIEYSFNENLHVFRIYF